MTRTALAACLALGLVTGAHAGPAADNATTHFRAIGSGDLQVLSATC